MSIRKDGSRQYPLYAEVAFTYDDVLAATTEAIDLPAGAEVVGGAIIVDVQFGGGLTLDVKDTEANTYATGVNADAVARTALDPVGLRLVTKGAVTVKVVGGTPAAGAGRVQVEYILPDRGHEVQPVSRSEYGSP